MINQYSLFIHDLCHKFSNIPIDHEDLYQEACIVLLTNGHKYDQKRGPVYNFIFKIVSNRLKDLYEEENKRVVCKRLGNTMHNENIESDLLLDLDQIIPDPLHRDIFQRYQSNYNFQEIAQQVGLCRQTVSGIVHSSLEKIKDYCVNDD